MQAPLVPKVVQVPKKKNWSKQAHQVWQVDGKEQVSLASGEQVSWMNIADEATTAQPWSRSIRL